MAMTGKNTDIQHRDYKAVNNTIWWGSSTDEEGFTTYCVIIKNEMYDGLKRVFKSVRCGPIEHDEIDPINNPLGGHAVYFHFCVPKTDRAKVNAHLKQLAGKYTSRPAEF